LGILKFWFVETGTMQLQNNDFMTLESKQLKQKFIQKMASLTPHKNHVKDQVSLSLNFKSSAIPIE